MNVLQGNFEVGKANGIGGHARLSLEPVRKAKREVLGKRYLVYTELPLFVGVTLGRPDPSGAVR